VLASPLSPERYKETALFSRFNMPTEVSKNFVDAPQIFAECKAENGQGELSLTAEKHVEYQIFVDFVPYQMVKDRQEKLSIKIPLSNKETVVKISAKYAGTESDATEKTFRLVNSEEKIAKPEKKKWYI
jgi:hypothetical protein